MADGSVTIDTNIKIDKLESQLLRLEKQILNASLTVDKLRTRLTELGSAKIPTQEFADIQNQINKAEGALAQIGERMQKFLDLGGDKRSKAFMSMAYDAEQLRETISYAKGELADLEETGKAFTLGKDSAEYETLTERLRIAEEELEMLGRKHEETTEKLAEQEENAMSRMEQGIGKVVGKHLTLDRVIRRVEASMRRMLNGMIRLGKKAISAIGKMASSMSSFGKHTNKSNNFLEAFINRIWRLAKRVFIFSLFTKAFRAMLNGIKEGFQSFAKYSDSFNKTMSDFKSSTGQLKNQLGSAFAPLAQTIIPLLTEFVSILSEASAQIAKFFAILSGSSTYAVAKKQVTDYAKSLDKASDSQKSMLASFDDLNVLDKNAGGDGTSASELYEQVPVDASGLANTLANAIKTGDWETVGSAISDKLAGVLNSLKWNSIKAKAKTFGTGFADFLNGVFRNDSLWNGVGTAVGEGINTLFEGVYSFFAEIDSKAIASAFTTAMNKAMALLDWNLIISTYRAGAQRLSELINRLADNFDWEGLKNSIVNGLKALSNSIVIFTLNTDFSELGRKVGKLIEDSIRDIDWHDIGRAIGGIIQSAFDFFSNVAGEINVESVTDAIHKLLKGITDSLTPEAEKMLESFGDALKTFFGVFLAFEGITIAVPILEFIAIMGGGIGASAGANAVVLGSALASVAEGLTLLAGAYATATIAGNITEELMKELGVWTEDLTDKYGENADGLQIIKDGLHGMIKEVVDGVPSGVTQMQTLTTAFEDIADGAIYTDEQLKTLQKDWDLSTEDMESLRQAMLDAHPELRQIADDFELYDASVETLDNLNTAFGQIERGLVPANKAFDVFSQSYHDFNDEALNSLKNFSDSGQSIGEFKESTKKASEEVAKTNEILAKSADTAEDAWARTAKATKDGMARTTKAVADETEAWSEAGEKGVENLADGATKASDTLKDSMQNITHDAMISAMDAMSTTLTGEEWSNSFSGMMDGFKLKWAEVVAYFTDEAVPTFFDTNVKTAFSEERWTNATDGITSGIIAQWTAFEALWKTKIAMWMDNSVRPYFDRALWTDFGTNMKDGIELGFEGITQIIHGILDSLITMFETAMNEVVDAVNDFIEEYNDVASKLGTPTLDTFSNFRFAKLPQLATGGITTGETLARIGEAGREAILPLENNTGWMQDLANMLNEKMGAGGAQTVVLELDGRELARTELPYFNSESARIGLSLRTI